MNKKTFSKIVSWALIATLSINMGVTTFAEGTNYTQSTATVTQNEHGFEYVIQTGNLSVQSNNSHINGEIQKTDNLLELECGLMFMLDSDSKSISNGYFGGTTIETESNIYSSDVYSASGSTAKVNHTVITEKNIYLSSENIYGENAILYSKSGDISINCNVLTDFKGIIYAPNGTVTLNGENVTIEGAIIAKEIYVQANNFTINKNDNVATSIDNFEYTKIDKLMGLYAYQDEETSEIVLEWNSDDNINSVDVYARYGNEHIFNKLDSTTEKEYRMSADSLVDKADYKIIVHTRFGEEIQSIITTLIKDENGIHIDTTDSDGDEIPDGYEISLGTNPNNSDTDNDSFSDGYEMTILYTDPLVYNEDIDFDNDCLTNLKELEIGTNPYLIDSDFDGIPDNEDAEPMKTNLNSEREVNYDVPVLTGVFDLITRHVDSEGNKSETVYNYLTGRMRFFSNSRNKSTYLYDDDTNLLATIEFVDGKYITNTYAYSDDCLTTITHNGFQYNFAYDEFGNIINATVGNSTLISSKYSENMLLTESYGNNSTNEYIYDENGNVISQLVNGVITYEWTYDTEGNILTHNDHSNNVIYSYSYDDEGNLITVKSNNGFEISYDQTDSTYAITYKNDDTVKTQNTIYNNSEESEIDGFVPTSSITNLISGGQLISIISSDETEETTIYSNEVAILTSNYTYSDNGVCKINYQDGKELQYIYDNEDNIISIFENGKEMANYEYDSLGQLFRENSVYANKTVVYNYDKSGNILKANEYEYTTGDLGKVISEKTYSYNNTDWKDLLTNFNGYDITYDEIGNPLSYRNGMQFTWNGRQLSSLQQNDNVVYYTYNTNGIRTSKIVNGIETIYQLDETKIVSETKKGNTNWYIYNENDSIIGFEYNSQTYYFEKNAQGDVVRIFDANGSFVSEYFYDAWGNIASISGNEEIANVNPFRYRGYYYDNESGFYYLQSRYYDSFTGRFLNADDTKQLENKEYNLYKYCSNNAVSYVDTEGNLRYNRNKARDYAYKWFDGFNPKFPNFDNKGGDCANFVSQCLNAGGYPMRYKDISFLPWYCKKKLFGWECSPSWSRTTSQYNNFKFSCIIAEYKIKNKSDLIKYSRNLCVGDIAYFDWNSNGKVDHATLITKVALKDLYFTAHSIKRKNRSIKITLDGKMTVYVVHIKPII